MISKILIRFIRIYTPFICTIMALLSGVFFCSDYVDNGFIFTGSATCGFSLIVIAYIYVTSLRMCLWYHLNLLCLFLIQICGILYHYIQFTAVIYTYVIILLSSLGVVSFVVFITLYRVSKLFTSIRKRL